VKKTAHVEVRYAGVLPPGTLTLSLLTRTTVKEISLTNSAIGLV